MFEKKKNVVLPFSYNNFGGHETNLDGFWPNSYLVRRRLMARLVKSNRWVHEF